MLSKRIAELLDGGKTLDGPFKSEGAEPLSVVRVDLDGGKKLDTIYSVVAKGGKPSPSKSAILAELSMRPGQLVALSSEPLVHLRVVGTTDIDRAC